MIDVLLVEDDILLARQFIQTIQLAGWNVRHARHAGEAITMVDNALPDVVILDMLLPATNGLALLHELQSYTDTENVPVVICSSIADSASLKELAPYGVKRLLDKTTMLPEDIISAIKAVT